MIEDDTIKYVHITINDNDFSFIMEAAVESIIKQIKFYNINFEELDAIDIELFRQEFLNLLNTNYSIQKIFTNNHTSNENIEKYFDMKLKIEIIEDQDIIPDGNTEHYYFPANLKHNINDKNIWFCT